MPVGDATTQMKQGCLLNALEDHNLASTTCPVKTIYLYQPVEFFGFMKYGWSQMMESNGLYADITSIFLGSFVKGLGWPKF